MKRNLSLQHCLAVILLVAASASVQAVEVVNNLGSAISGGAAVFGTDPVLSNATSFTTGPGGWQINSVTVKIEEVVGTSVDGYVLQVMNDNGGNPGSTVVGTFDMSSNNVTTLNNYTYSPTAPLVLSGSTTYWLAGFPTAADSEYYWQVTTSFNDNGVLGWSIGDLNRSSNNLGTTWVPNGNEPNLFSIDATSLVPEPTSLLLGLLAVSGVGLFGRGSR
jgi:hypothetical protein